MTKRPTTLRRAAVLLVAVAPFLMAAGAAAQSWDIPEGRYLTEEEYKKLSRDEAEEYCRELAREIDIQNDNAVAAEGSLQDLRSAVADLESRLSTLEAGNAPLAAEVAELERELNELRERPRSYTVMPDDWLRKISARSRIYGDEDKWKRLYRGNREKIEDPNLIFPGQELEIPRGRPVSHVVVEGETLRIIAGRWEIYGDREQWIRIYEANRDKIADPDVIHPGLVLAIPR